MDQKGPLGDEIVPRQSRGFLYELAQVVLGIVGRALRIRPDGRAALAWWRNANE